MQVTMKNITLFLLLFVILSLSNFSNTSHASVLMTEGFDAGSCNWVGNIGCLQVGAQVLQVDTSFKRSGAGSLRYLFDYPLVGSCLSTHPNFNGQQCGGNMDRGHSATIESWRTFWLYLGTNFIVGPTSTKIILEYVNIQNHFSAWLVFAFGSRTLGLTLQRVPAGSGNSVNVIGGTIPLGAWTCVETYQKLSDPGVSNGIAQIYVNGTLTASKTDVLSRGVGDNALFTNQHIIRQDGSGDMFMDDLTVSTTRQGCGGNPPPPPDTTPPPQVSQPTGTPVSTSQINWTWPAVTDPSTPTGPSGISLYLAEICSGDGCVNFSGVTPSPTANSLSSTGLQAGTKYSLRVKAQDGAGNQSTNWSVVGTATTNSNPPPPVDDVKVTSVITDATGADITFDGLATAVRYWNNDILQSNPTEIPFVVPVNSYRHNFPATDNTYQCYQAKGANNVWETTTWICNSLVVGDIVPPAKPQGLRIE